MAWLRRLLKEPCPVRQCRYEHGFHGMYNTQTVEVLRRGHHNTSTTKCDCEDCIFIEEPCKQHGLDVHILPV